MEAVGLLLTPVCRLHS